MFYIRILAILLIALPQAFAPLVHAHVGVDVSPPGMHLPGLDLRAGPQDGMAGTFLPVQEEGIVVSADDGVRQPVDGLFPQFHVLLPQEPTLPRLREGDSFSFSWPQAPPLIPPLLHVSPRAPPA